MIDEKFVFLAVILNIIGGFGYLIDTISGKVKPHKASWLLWTLVPLIIFIAQINQHVGLTSLFTLIAIIIPVLIFIASFINKKADWKITKFDIMCAILSLGSLILWLITREGNLAILLAIIADLLATIPTMLKSYQAPETENSNAYLLGGLGGLITALTIKQWDFAHYSFPLYVFLTCLVLFSLIKFKLGRKIKISA